jgi:Cysteine-rich secretory protein family
VNPIRIPLLALALLLTGCTPKPAGVFGSWTPTARATPEIAPLERRMAKLVNADRAKEGLPPLSYDEDLADVARGHSLDMRDTGFFAHESPTTGVLEDRMVVAGYLALEMRENLAQAPDVERAEVNLMNSPGHHANIMADSVSRIGIGIVQGGGGDARVLTVTQVFARPITLDTPDTVERKVVAALQANRQKRGWRGMEQHDLLQSLSERHIDELPDDVPESAVSKVGDAVSEALNGASGHGLVSIGIVAQAFFSGDEFSLPSAATDQATNAYGIATSDAVDEHGRPRVKVLLLMGKRGR